MRNPEMTTNRTTVHGAARARTHVFFCLRSFFTCFFYSFFPCCFFVVVPPPPSIVVIILLFQSVNSTASGLSDGLRSDSTRSLTESEKRSRRDKAARMLGNVKKGASVVWGKVTSEHPEPLPIDKVREGGEGRVSDERTWPRKMKRPLKNETSGLCSTRLCALI